MAFSTCSEKSVYTMMAGKLAITIVAPIPPQSVVNSPWKNNTPRGKVFSSAILPTTTFARMNSFQAFKKMLDPCSAIFAFVHFDPVKVYVFHCGFHVVVVVLGHGVG